MNKLQKIGEGNRPHIGIFGKRNAGKSSLINILTGQNLAIVSEQAGTTTDPVKKTMEVLGLGPVVLIDTAGIDDQGELGKARVHKTMDAVKQVDLALLLITDSVLDENEKRLIETFRHFKIPFIFVYNKSDVRPPNPILEEILFKVYKSDFISFSTQQPANLENLIHLIKKNIEGARPSKLPLFKGLLHFNDIVLLITPIDSEAPEDRLILPQVQAIRGVLDNNAIAIVLKETELVSFLTTTTIKPALVVTDSQLFGAIDRLIDANIPLTSFSILLARQKGNFDYYLKGTPAIARLKDGDRILLLESCTHQSNCDDIGRMKIPRWLSDFTGKKLHFEVVSGLSPLPRPATDYALAIQCGGCMITQKQLQNRLKPFIDAGVPATNYGMAIAFINGIFERATALFKK